jgi:hypothetical protein
VVLGSMLLKVAQRFHHWTKRRGEQNFSSKQHRVELGDRRPALRKLGAPTMPPEADAV